MTWQHRSDNYIKFRVSTWMCQKKCPINSSSKAYPVLKVGRMQWTFWYIIKIKGLSQPLFLYIFLPRSQTFLLFFKIILSISSSGFLKVFWGFSLDVGCIFTHLQSSPFNNVTYFQRNVFLFIKPPNVDLWTIRINKAPNSRDEPVLHLLTKDIFRKNQSNLLQRHLNCFQFFSWSYRKCQRLTGINSYFFSNKVIFK